MEIRTETDLAALDFEKSGGLVPVVAQEAGSGEILMLAYADQAALERCLQTRQMWYYSRSRQRLWQKGESSGNTQRLVSLHADCDGDAVLARVEAAGPACHTGEANCFGTAPTLAELARVLAERQATAPETSYTARLLSDRNLRLKKLGEEVVELVLACADGEQVAEEAADVIYHLLVACLGAGVPLGEVLTSLGQRLPATSSGA